jgi:uncharacterized protein YjbI with pentapeptide repeats
MRQQKLRNRSSAPPRLRDVPEDRLREVLASHRVWLDSNGERGEQADLSHAQLQGLSLWSADLREANLS